MPAVGYRGMNALTRWSRSTSLSAPIVVVGLLSVMRCRWVFLHR